MLIARNCLVKDIPTPPSVKCGKGYKMDLQKSRESKALANRVVHVKQTQSLLPRTGKINHPVNNSESRNYTGTNLTKWVTEKTNQSPVINTEARPRFRRPEQVTKAQLFRVNTNLSIAKEGNGSQLAKEVIGRVLEQVPRI